MPGLMRFRTFHGSGPGRPHFRPCVADDIAPVACHDSPGGAAGIPLAGRPGFPWRGGRDSPGGAAGIPLAGRPGFPWRGGRAGFEAAVSPSPARPVHCAAATPRSAGLRVPAAEKHPAL